MSPVLWSHPTLDFMDIKCQYQPLYFIRNQRKLHGVLYQQCQFRDLDKNSSHMCNSTQNWWKYVLTCEIYEYQIRISMSAQQWIKLESQPTFNFDKVIGNKNDVPIDQGLSAALFWSSRGNRKIRPETKDDGIVKQATITLSTDIKITVYAIGMN